MESDETEQIFHQLIVDEIAYSYDIGILYEIIELVEI